MWGPPLMEAETPSRACRAVGGMSRTHCVGVAAAHVGPGRRGGHGVSRPRRRPAGQVGRACVLAVGNPFHSASAEWLLPSACWARPLL